MSWVSCDEMYCISDALERRKAAVHHWLHAGNGTSLWINYKLTCHCTRSKRSHRNKMRRSIGTTPRLASLSARSLVTWLSSSCRGPEIHGRSKSLYCRPTFMRCVSLYAHASVCVCVCTGKCQWQVGWSAEHGVCLINGDARCTASP